MKLNYGFAFILFLFTRSNYFVADIYRYPWGAHSQARFFHHIFVIYLFASLLLGINDLFRIFKTTNVFSERNKIKYVALSFLTISLTSTGFFLAYNINIYPIFYQIFGIAFSIIVSYAILKYQLLDIRIVIGKSLVYSILATIITVAYFVVIYLTENIFRGFIGYKSLYFALGVIAISILLLQPLKNRIQYIVDRLFFKGTLDTLSQEKELMQEELIRSERLKAVATLAAGMAHEIKNPLTAIKTFTEHLKEKKDDPEFIAKFERIVGGEVDKINNIVHQLLNFAKPAPLKLETTNLNHLLGDTLSLLSNDLIKHKIKLIKAYADIPNIQADPNQLKQAFLNLLLNAIEAMPDGGELTVVTQTNEQRLQVSIKDTGKGISPKDLPHIFDPFYSTKDKGSGLGLSITHEIIKKHNGSISVESEAGAGAVVRITFK